MDEKVQFRGDLNKIAKRLFSLREIANAIKEIFFDNADDIYLNNALLLGSIESYFIDLNRAKAFHEIAYADAHKRAAYTIKWIVKLKPIQVLRSKGIERKHLLANEIFALIAGLSFLEIEIHELS